MKSVLASVRALRMPAISIRLILLAITTCLTLMIALLAGQALLSNYNRLKTTQELRAAIAISDQLFDATGKISIERDLALSMLQARDADTIASLSEPLADARRDADQSVSAALAALDTNPRPELAALRTQIEQRHGEIRAMRALVDRALATPAARDPGLAGRWEETSTALMSDAEGLWVAFTAPFTGVDAVITQHLRYRHLLRAITDYTGRERSIIGQILSESVHPTPEQTAQLLRGQGILEQDWALTRLIAEQSGLYPAIAAEYVDAESHYATVHDMTREMFYVPGQRRGRAVYPIGPDFWFELSSQASESLAALRAVSRDATRAYLDQIIASTERAIFVQVLVSLVAFGLCAASFWLIVAQVIGPIGRIIDALTRATRGESVDFTIGRQRNDEIGKLAFVLDAYQHNLEAVRRTSAERDEAARRLEGEVVVRRSAEEKAQLQLERLALLHQISRAIGERQDLTSIFEVAAGDVEARLPADFVCVCLRTGDALDVVKVAPKSADLARAMGMGEGGQIEIDANGLSRCMTGRLVYEPDLAERAFAFPRRLAGGGLRSFVAAPLQVESRVFGALIVARLGDEGFSSAECEFLRQLSEHVALAAHQAQLYTALQHAYDELRQTQDAVMQQERLRALGQMASGIAHDINNALSPIALYTESLLGTEPGLTKAGRAKLEIVQRAIDDAAHTISRMGEFYKKRNRDSPLGVVDPNTLVAQVLDLTQARWRDMSHERGQPIEVKTELSPDMPSIMGVESELREALTNLVFNAVDALPGGGTITLRTKQSVRGAVQIEIEDNGIGMDEPTRLRCLEPFYTTKGERGTGLGLAMVYGAVQRHGGEIEIESELGRGTLMRLSFVSGTAAAKTRVGTTEAPRPRLRLRLLVVDDDPILLRSLRDVLEQDGQLVTAANDGVAGVAAFIAAHEQGQIFDAVITDLGMPGMDGRRVAAAIKEAAADVPIILLTGWGERLKAEEEKPPHIDYILSKPPKLAELRATLAIACGEEIPANAARA
jgi:signal transduction histidine kinase/ActR/RegA family two-component response regulator